jgi:hypothetical protein
MKNDTLYINNSKECGAASQIVYNTLTEDEKKQMQKIMRMGCGMEDGTYAVENCELTRKMFAGYYR